MVEALALALLYSTKEMKSAGASSHPKGMRLIGSSVNLNNDSGLEKSSPGKFLRFNQNQDL